MLSWWADSEPAIRRVRAGRGFRYLGPDGSPIAKEEIARIRRLAIPPAWRDVRICPNPNGYLQATGRDARGRKQYRYHPAWRAGREDAKFVHLLEFGEALPAIRARVEHDLRRPGMPREKVLALVVRLLDLTLLRVGNERYAMENRSFGLTTLANRHAAVDGSSIRLRFRGKGGRIHELGLRDRRLARLVQRCRDLPGRHLFEYVDDEDVVRTVRSEDVNAYLREAAGTDVTAKMFRTWSATVLACRLLGAAEPPAQAGDASRQSLRTAIEAVAERLGNTPGVARTSYIHPAVPEAFALGRLRRPRDQPRPRPGEAVTPWTRADERATLALLRDWVASRDGTPVKRRGRRA